MGFQCSIDCLAQPFALQNGDSTPSVKPTKTVKKVVKKKTKLKEKVENGSAGECENGSEATASATSTVIIDKDDSPAAANGVDSNPSPPLCDESDNNSAENGLEVEAVSNGHNGEDAAEVRDEAAEANGETAEVNGVVEEVNGEASTPAAEDNARQSGENDNEGVYSNGISDNNVEQGT